MNSNMEGTSEVEMPGPHVNTDGRTGRTYEDPHANPALVTSATRAGGAEADVEIGERFQVIRTGERAEIPWDVRRAVYRRDGWRCKFCGCTWTDDQLELDHVIPWSAGGSDAGHNLRTLCRRCNGERSNYRLNWDDGRIFLPVTWWCIDCHGPYDPEDRDVWFPVRPPLVRASPPRFTPHDRMTFAYCATCDINGYTEVAL